MRTHTSLLVVLILTASLPAAEPLLTGPALVPPQVVGREWNPRLTPVVKVVKRVRNAVVNIRSERMTRANGPEDLLALETSQNHVNGMGTGIIIDPRGYIVTNQHVVEGVDVAPRPPGRRHEPTAAALWPATATPTWPCSRSTPARPLPVMPLGTATDLMVGETVIAIGNAYGYEHTVIGRRRQRRRPRRGSEQGNVL